MDRPSFLAGHLMRMAVSGVTKNSAIRHLKEEHLCSDQEIQSLLNLCSFQSKPKRIDYSEFYRVGKRLSSKGAKRSKYPFTQLYTLDNFATKEECQLMIDIINREATPSFVANPEDEQLISDYRTSQTANLSYLNHPELFEIDFKITSLTQLNPLLSEVMQGQKYNIGQYYKQHCDFFNPWTKEHKVYCEWMGQRTWTFMLYLNDVGKGGETYFKRLGLKIKPKQGTAVFWNNLYKNGFPNYRTLHEALPPASGEKFIVTKWFRSWSLI
jgi:prolyl 4-hydroxylase